MKKYKRMKIIKPISSTLIISIKNIYFLQMINFLPLFCFFQKNSQIEFDASCHKKYDNFLFFFYFYILYKFKIILNPIKHFHHCFKSQKINIFIPKRSKSIQLKLNYFHFKTYIFTQTRRHYRRIHKT